MAIALNAYPSLNDVSAQLIGDIGRYEVTVIDTNPIAHDSRLYAGIQQYEDSRENKIKEYELRYENNSSVREIDLKNPKYFREKFARFVAELNQNENLRYRGSEETRKNHPEKAKIKMNDLFGAAGVELYKLALEEEAQDRAFTSAVYQSSIVPYPGEEWVERPVLLVGGPSGSGKTSSAEAALEMVNPILETKKGTSAGNAVVTVDGGNGRKVSHILDLALQVAENKGYTGISDIHSKSKILETTKQRIYNYALHETRHGMVIPETFSAFFKKSDQSRKMLNEVLNAKGVKPIFARVQGRKSVSFRKVVSVMANRRAWKSGEFNNKKELQVHRKERSYESKAYMKGGFSFGVVGSMLAERWFATHAKLNTSLVVTNTLELRKKNQDGDWVRARNKDTGVILVDHRIYAEWAVKKAYGETEIDLDDYAKQNRKKPTITYSSEMGLLICKKKVEEKIEALKISRGKESNRRRGSGSFTTSRMDMLEIWEQAQEVLRDTLAKKTNGEAIDWMDVYVKIDRCATELMPKSTLFTPAQDKIFTEIKEHLINLHRVQLMKNQIDPDQLLVLAKLVLADEEFKPRKYNAIRKYIADEFSKVLSMNADLPGDKHHQENIKKRMRDFLSNYPEFVNAQPKLNALVKRVSVDADVSFGNPATRPR